MEVEATPVAAAVVGAAGEEALQDQDLTLPPAVASSTEDAAVRLMLLCVLPASSVVA